MILVFCHWTAIGMTTARAPLAGRLIITSRGDLGGETVLDPSDRIPVWWMYLPPESPGSRHLMFNLAHRESTGSEKSKTNATGGSPVWVINDSVFVGGERALGLGNVSESRDAMAAERDRAAGSGRMETG